MTDLTQTDAGWLSREEMDAARERLPILYVDAVPVRVDETGTVTSGGLLLRIGQDGTLGVDGRTIPAAQVLERGRFDEFPVVALVPWPAGIDLAVIALPGR